MESNCSLDYFDVVIGHIEDIVIDNEFQVRIFIL